jgi:hypothetical protein
VKLAAYLRAYPGSTKTSLRSLGNSDTIDEALLAMIEAGHIHVEVSGRSHLHTLTEDGEAAYPPAEE